MSRMGNQTELVPARAPRRWGDWGDGERKGGQRKGAIATPVLSPPPAGSGSQGPRDSGCSLAWTESLPGFDPGAQRWREHPNPALTCGRHRRWAALSRGRLHGAVACRHAWQRCCETLALVAGCRLALQSAGVALPRSLARRRASSSLAPPPASRTVL